MEFYNETSFSTLTHRTTIGDENIAMSAQCRVVFDVDREGNSTISETQDWELKAEYWESDFGPMDKDDVYIRGGVDVLLFGMAKAPHGTMVSQMEVEVLLNNKTVHKVNVFGNRNWNSFFGILVKSRPEPFESIPLSLQNAFGGTTEWDGLKIPYPSNPYGKGYYYKKEEAKGNALPNIEHVDDPITTWKSWQEPAGLSSFPILPVKAKHHVVLEDDNSKIKKVDDRFFNSAFPQMIVENVSAGDIFSATNVTGAEAFKFTIPELPLEIEIKVGEISKKRTMKIEQVGLLPETSQAFITYNFPFKYTLVPLEKRKTMIRLLKN